MASNYDWSRFVKRININASTEQLYNAWATRTGIESWFLRMGEFSATNGVVLANDTPVQKGNTYKWRWYGYPDDTTEYGEIIEANGSDLIAFTFATQMKVSIQIKTEEGENMVELEQYDIPVDEKGKTEKRYQLLIAPVAKNKNLIKII
jgi:uncharacterized protein YndB with AHSA1/START domain